MANYTQLTPRERRRLRYFIDINLPIVEISNRLNRHRSTIYREIKRNHTNGLYLPARAHEKAQKRKNRKPYKFKFDNKVYKYVIRKLRRGWSPEQISGRLKIIGNKGYVCHETIYQYIYKHARSDLYYYLPTQRKKRMKRYQRRVLKHFNGNKSIISRPSEVNERNHIGHWEGDTIRFSSNRYTSITTLVERKSRFLILCKNIKSTTEIVMNNLLEKLKKHSKKYYKTITFDQGVEFADFYCVERAQKCDIYYAQPRSPWQRGTNENTNGRLRRYIPRNLDLTKISQDWLDELAAIFNNTPRKCLGFRTPKEVFLMGEI